MMLYNGCKNQIKKYIICLDGQTQLQKYKNKYVLKHFATIIEKNNYMYKKI